MSDRPPMYGVAIVLRRMFPPDKNRMYDKIVLPFVAVVAFTTDDFKPCTACEITARLEEKKKQLLQNRTIIVHTLTLIKFC